MTNYLLDTNVLLRASDPNSLSYPIARDVIYCLLDRGDKACLTSQVLIEFWVVATRPTDVNGFGWSPERTKNQINQFIPRFNFLEENSEIFPHWLQMVTDYNIKGKRSHDIRLLAVMKAHNISHLLTFNPDDFLSFPYLTIIHPQQYLDFL